jgi:raffinose/stachyose/melibiose transport system permease protein
MAASTQGRAFGRGLRWALVFLLPLALFYGAFYLYSFWFLLSTSVQKTDLTLANATFVGLENFRLVLTHEAFQRALINTVAFALVAIIAGLTIGFFLAVVLATKPRGGRALYAIFLLPVLMPMSLVASVFAVMLESRFGLVNEFLRAIGLDALALRWLVDPTWAWVSVAMIFVYIVGLPIMYYTANLSTMNVSLLEAAAIDGANARQMFRFILYPAMSGARRTIIMATLLMSFRAFEIVFLSTRGGPSGATEIAGTYLYNFATSGSSVGYVSAASVIVLAIALVISAVQLGWQHRADRNDPR